MNEIRYKVKSLKRSNVPPAGEQSPPAKFQTFEDLEAYQAAREFRMAMYAVSRRLPDSEKYGLMGQIRRAALSLTNNLAEGHGRYHYADQIKFVLIARGSLQELLDDLNVCLDEKYLPSSEVETLKQQGWRVLNIINGYGRFLRQKKAGQSLTARETAPGDLPEVEDDPFADFPL